MFLFSTINMTHIFCKCVVVVIYIGVPHGFYCDTLLEIDHNIVHKFWMMILTVMIITGTSGSVHQVNVIALSKVYIYMRLPQILLYFILAFFFSYFADWLDQFDSWLVWFCHTGIAIYYYQNQYGMQREHQRTFRLWSIYCTWSQ